MLYTGRPTNIPTLVDNSPRVLLDIKRAPTYIVRCLVGPQYYGSGCAQVGLNNCHYDILFVLMSKF